MATLTELMEEYKIACDALETAKRKESMARAEEADCRNHVNSLQKQLDAAFDEARKAAPGGTDWGSRRDRRVEVAS